MHLYIYIKYVFNMVSIYFYFPIEFFTWHALLSCQKIPVMQIFLLQILEFKVGKKNMA